MDRAPGENVLNRFGVVRHRTGIMILNAPLQAKPAKMAAQSTLPAWPAVAPLSMSEALNLAAWLVALTGQRAEFDLLLDEIQRT